ncbi:DUF3466 family protein [Colwellia psychrerythraea]|uniref:DUF3466 family protein n=1 Tax=Colwellia psychrerythraea (strain 34H / ATCC BAA-681) TaxID=167879 RepID=Q47Z12_COLP3|nr:DUF3466 family protein [Colwellia psychrerythraea]AAZ27004.1 hypothetical protein CPS_3276 [Colwellia psychrerythraea 34H]
MKQFAKNILVLGVTSALSLSFLNFSHAATYEVVDKGNAENLEYTYGKKQNNQGVMAVAGTNIYNFPVQFEHLSETDFNSIRSFALQFHDYQFGLDEIEDFEALKAGNPTANDLAWTKLFLQDRNSSSQNPNFEYQIVGDTAAMTNLGDGSQSTEMRIFDTGFDGTYSAGSVITRSTVDVIEGVTDSNIAFGTASAPYLAMPEFTDSSGNLRTHWVREHGQRGFFSPDSGATIYPVLPIETRYGGGISAVFDMNENGSAVGYSSYKLSELREEYVLDETGGCADPGVVDDIPYEICVQKVQSGMYYIQAFKATLSADNLVETEQLGLLVTPHVDDNRAFSSQALAVNNNGVAVGYAHGWDANDVTTPTSTQPLSGSYAVIFKEDELGNKVVFDFNQLHYRFNTNSVFSFSRALDINDNGLAVGYTHEISTSVKKFFYVDTTVPESEMELITPKDFFTTSKSTAFAVNSTGIIVGEAEIESHNDSTNNPRRTAGFLYDTSNDAPVMTDLNTLLECNSEYNVLNASDINDEGLISATAVIKSDSYDAKGELRLDASGNAIRIDVVRAILLKPITGGVIDDCSEVEEKVERQGASIGGIAILALFSLLGLRRRIFNK